MEFSQHEAIISGYMESMRHCEAIVIDSAGKILRHILLAGLADFIWDPPTPSWHLRFSQAFLEKQSAARFSCIPYYSARTRAPT